jgi:CubicO group peptidase (beta-lactamase class C family)
VRRPWLVVLLAAALAAAPAASQQPLAPVDSTAAGFSANRLQRVGAALRSEIDRGAIPGAVVAIAGKGRLVYHEAFGALDTNRNVPMPKDAIFAIASMTKPLTAVGALMLVEEGRLALSDPVGRYLPALADMRVATEYGTEPARRPPHLQDLLRHTAGLTYGSAAGSELLKRYAELTAGNPKADEFIGRLGKLPLHYQPGTRWDYGIGHEVMGVVIETLTGQRLGDFLAERLFRPVGMADTGFFVPAANAGRVARPLAKDPITGQSSNVPLRTEPPDFDNGGAGAYSTALDYLRFAEVLRRGGTFAGTRYLGRKTVEFMTSDQLTPEIDDQRLQERANISGYGFGSSVAVRRTAGFGGMPGSAGDFNWGGAYGTYFWVDPAEELSVVFMAAAPGETRNRMRQLITALVYQALE